MNSDAAADDDRGKTAVDIVAERAHFPPLHNTKEIAKRIEGDDNSIWEQMVNNENRLLARQQRKKISEIEEELSLMSASAATSSISSSTSASTTPSSLLSFSSSNASLSLLSTLPASEIDDHVVIKVEKTAAGIIQRIKNYDSYEAQKKGSRWWLLPEDVSNIVLFFLGDIDQLGYLFIVAKTTTFLPSAYVYRIYLQNMFKKSTLPLTELRNTKISEYKRILQTRARLRKNGFYSIKSYFSKAPNNDAFWEEKRVEVRSFICLFVFLPSSVFSNFPRSIFFFSFCRNRA